MSSLVGGGHNYLTRPILIDPTTVRALATVVPCPLCDTRGLCSRCWTIATVVEQLTVAARRDQATDDPWAVAA